MHKLKEFEKLSRVQQEFFRCSRISVIRENSENKRNRSGPNINRPASNKA
jgi:hypothetical protein